MKHIIRDIELSKITDTPLSDESVIIQEFFDKLFNGLEITTLDKYPDSIFFVKNGSEFYMEQNSKNEELYCSYNKIWSFLETKFGYKYDEIQHLIKYMVEEQLKCRVSTPYAGHRGYNYSVEEQLKCRVSTPSRGLGSSQITVEQLKCRVSTSSIIHTTFFYLVEEQLKCRVPTPEITELAYQHKVEEQLK